MGSFHNLRTWRMWLIGFWFCSLISTGFNSAVDAGQCKTLALITKQSNSCVCKSSSLSCYICNSTLDSNCQERFNHDSVIVQDKYKGCFMWNAQFCIKVTGLWGGMVGTHRFCSSRDLGDQCQDMWFPDHDRMYRACVYTCTGDGCNSATSLSISSALVMSIFGIIVAIVRTLS